MKKIIIAACLCIGCASAEINDSQHVIELPKMSKIQIYQKAIQWITLRFVSGRAVIDYKDQDMGRIIGKGVLVVPYELGSRAELSMIATIDAIDRKSRITVSINNCESVAPDGIHRYPCTGLFVTGKGLQDIKAKPQLFIDDYEQYMTGSVGPAWDGK